MTVMMELLMNKTLISKRRYGNWQVGSNIANGTNQFYIYDSNVAVWLHQQ